MPGLRPVRQSAAGGGAEGIEYSAAAGPGACALTRSQLIAELAASHPHLRVADVELLVTTIFDRIADALTRGSRVELRGFGAFTVRRRKARLGRNPSNGEPVSVNAKSRPFFTAGKELRDRLNHQPSRPASARLA